MPPGGPVTSDSDMESVLSLQIEIPRVRRNSVGPKYYCSVEGCGQSFKRLDHLDRHEYKHTGIKKHACHYENCTKTYSIVTHLKRHIRSTHERQPEEVIKNVPCEVDTCDKLFTSISNMQRHIREVHENPKVYQCQFCEEKFTQKLKMRRHEISKHTGIYPYNCDKCSRGFYQKWQWEKHEETCKIYPCSNCDETFDKWTLFLKHCKETQHSRKYYKCEYCERAYVKPGELQKHVAAKHLEDENSCAGAYKCSYEGCQKSYAYERNLRQHIATTHEGKKFKCSKEDCDKEFSSSQNLQKHLKRDHCPEMAAKQKEQATNSNKTTLKRKQRKDAGMPKVSHLAQLSGITVDKDLNKRLKSRDFEALEEVKKQLSQEMDVDITSEEEEEVVKEIVMENENSVRDVAKNGILKQSTFKSVNKNAETITEGEILEENFVCENEDQIMHKTSTDCTKNETYSQTK
ncbi:transcription factor IIIA [Lucilia cuprina]|uniref:transcription factor IIIA n=1 Tax=Lucilia cuprina TaxID=7375 RepID=UPI001F06B943|nr:transcription factor IIIA [Lucilia cuprina]